MPPTKSLLWLLGTLAAFLALEAAIFRSGWYNKYFEPESLAGSVELQMYWLNHFRPRHVDEIMVLGDSRMAEGFSAHQANMESGLSNLVFWNLGIPASTPRMWYYILRDADPTHRRFQAIAMTLDYYNDEDHYDDAADRIWDLNFLIGRLRLSDIWDFSQSMQTDGNRRKAFLGATLKGTVIERDARELLADLPGRVKRAKHARQFGLGYIDGYPGREENLEGLTADWSAKKLNFPANLPNDRRQTVTAALLPILPPITGKTTRYRREWFGRIVDLYRNSHTRLIFLEPSRGPLPQPDRPGPQTFVEWARQQPNVIVLPQLTFRDLERPTYFFDGYHFNRVGRELFTSRLTRLVMNALHK